jgi:urease accessory protein
LLRHRIELGNGSVADDEVGTPLACISELRYPEAAFDAAGTLLELASGGGLATWQGERL